MARKKAKVPSGKRAAVEKPDAKNDQVDQDDTGGTVVNWAIPKTKAKKKNEQIPDAHLTDAYAEALYGLSPDELKTVQTPLPDAQLRAPIYQKASAKDLAPNDVNQSTSALRSFFNSIKQRSTSSTKSPYHLNILTQTFGQGEDTALVLSRAEDAEIKVLDEDGRLEV
ncbi:hypothetical protein GMOD_00007401 [Pyrenophora seminiperda CCB06]|uniref:Uncharacterized protein n=1 Tax=Pyrenophora seminiperda CCB06 TaxID=1302712 RepID=A0A3M7MDD9_9PLEO|nr:hypothetical protein GMOD_00007401 [Pyrenophora seminiperda CCB06]